MSTLKFNSMFKFLSEHSIEINPESIDAELFCSICKKLMIDACQSVCGCCYCYRCISDHLRDVDQYCPGQKLECKEEHLILNRDVLKNDRLNLKISKLSIACSSCDSRIEIIHMDEHRKCCPSDPTENLKVEIILEKSKEEETTHLGYGPMMEFTKNLENEVVSLKEKVKTYEDEISIMKMQLKEYEIEVSEMKNDLKCVMDALKYKETSMESCEQQSKIKDKNELITDEDWFEKELKKDRTLSRMTKDTEDQMIQIRKETTKKVEKMLDLFNCSDGRMTRAELKYDELKIDILNERRFEYVWRIDKFLKRRKSVRAGHKEDICSDYFYTHTNGYKMKLCLCPNGYDSLEYVTLYFKFVPGMFDSILLWPFRHTVTLAIVDQNIGTSCLVFVADYRSTSDQYKYVFSRPSESGSDGFGYDVKLEDLLNCPGLMVKDTVFVKCSVSSPPVDQ